MQGNALGEVAMKIIYYVPWTKIVPRQKARVLGNPLVTVV